MEGGVDGVDMLRLLEGVAGKFAKLVRLRNRLDSKLVNLFELRLRVFNCERLLKLQLIIDVIFRLFKLRLV